VNLIERDGVHEVDPSIKCVRAPVRYIKMVLQDWSSLKKLPRKRKWSAKGF
jgi:hypothetical protein